MIFDEINLGGSIEQVHNPVSILEIVVWKQTSAILMLVVCKRLLIGLSDDMESKVGVQCYLDARAILLKFILE